MAVRRATAAARTCGGVHLDAPVANRILNAIIVQHDHTMLCYSMLDQAATLEQARAAGKRHPVLTVLSLNRSGAAALPHGHRRAPCCISTILCR